MDKYKIIQEIGKGSYGSVYKIQKIEQTSNELLSSQEGGNKLQQDSVGTNGSTEAAKNQDKNQQNG